MPAAFPQSAYPLIPVAKSYATRAFTINSVYTFNSGNDACGVRTVAPVGLSSAALKVYAYCNSAVGTVTNLFYCEIRESPPSGSADDANRPRVTGGSVIATSAAATPVTDEWCQFDFTGVTLAENKVYWFIIYGISGVDGSNYAEWLERSGAGFQTEEIIPFIGFATADGFTSDPSTETSGGPPMVIVWDDGGSSEIITGNPFSAAVTGSPASGANFWRGCRITPSVDVVVCGAIMNSTLPSGTADFALYQGATAIISKAGLDLNAFRDNGSFAKFAETTLTAGTAYDFVFRTTSAGATGSQRMEVGGVSSPPADVLACIPGGDSVVKHVYGATPGSFTELAAAYPEVFPVGSSFPAASVSKRAFLG